MFILYVFLVEYYALQRFIDSDADEISHLFSNKEKGVYFFDFMGY